MLIASYALLKYLPFFPLMTFYSARLQYFPRQKSTSWYIPGGVMSFTSLERKKPFHPHEWIKEQIWRGNFKQ